MKKMLSFLLSMMLLLIPITANAQSQVVTKPKLEQEVLDLDEYTKIFSNKNVLNIKASELNTVSTKAENLKDYIRNGGIIIVENNTDRVISLCGELEMMLEPKFFDKSNTVSKNVNENVGTDIATIYYTYGDDYSGIYVINALTDITDSEKEELLAEAIEEIYATKSSYSTSEIQPYATNSTNKTLGNFTVTTTRQPKGKLTAKYEFFTVQNYNGEDYYTARANVTGYPGSSLSSTSSSYESKYYGLSLGTTIKTTSSSVTVDSYGPHRQADVTTYSVSVGASFNANSGTTFGANFSYSKNMPDTDIEADCTRTQAEWEVDLHSKARKKSINFVPAVTFVCPDSKSSMSLSLQSTYDLDSLLTFSELISINRTVTCTPTKYS